MALAEVFCSDNRGKRMHIQQRIPRNSSVKGRRLNRRSNYPNWPPPQPSGWAKTSLSIFSRVLVGFMGAQAVC